MSKIKSVYIHIPFCSRICTYCDFAKMIYHKKFANLYLDSLSNEIKKRYKGEKIETLYIGGGTPSVLSVAELEQLFAIIKTFKFQNDCEFTIECNITDITEEKVELFKKNGVNRLSLGIQTFNKKVLGEMNRFHTYEEVKQKIALIKKYGINNINVDLIYAFPNTTIADLKADLEKFFSLEITHISTYSLMIEPHTLLYINNVKNISEDLDYEMYSLITMEMKKHGFIHYEVSNFSLSGYESKHNLTYWNNLEYYGFGLSASGYIDNLRYTNTLSLDKYLKNEYKGSEEYLTKKDKIIYELILGMRKINGVNIEDFNKKFAENILENHKIKELLGNGNLIQNDIFLKIPYNKIYIENEILEELLDYE